MTAAESLATRKARRAFFTPAPLCRYIADWAVRASDDDILEPSCGEARLPTRISVMAPAPAEADDSGLGAVEPLGGFAAQQQRGPGVMHSDLPGLSDHGSGCPLLTAAGGL